MPKPLVLLLLAATAIFAQKPASLRLYVFDCGTLYDRDPANYGLTRQQVASVNMADPCYLVVHPQGTLLWETGLNDAIYSRPEGGGDKHDKVPRTLKSQLAAIGYKPADIKYLAMSHLHGDHSGNANDYASATWIVQKAERDYMFSAGLPATIHPDQYAALKNAKTMQISGDHDVFGDGSVMLIATPGHTPGHQSLLLKLPKTGAVVISGDLFHFPGERTHRTFPVNDQKEVTAAARAKVETLLQKNKAQLWIHHDITAYGKLKKSPAYYE